MRVGNGAQENDAKGGPGKWALVTLGLILLSVPLRYGPLSEPLLSSGDEALTALRSLGLMEQGYYWTPYWNGEPNLHKPPLYYWLVALGYNLWGVGEFALRLPSVTCYLILIVITFVMTRRLMDDLAGCIAAALLAWNPVLFSQSRLGMMDTLVVLLIMGGGYALWRAAEEQRYYYIWGAACGLSLMAKGLGAVAIIPLSIVYLILVRPRSFISGHLYWAFLSGMTLPALWFGSHYLFFKEHFLREYVRHEIVYRIKHDVWQTFTAQKTTMRLWKAWGAAAPFGFAAPLLLFFTKDSRSSVCLFKEKWKELSFLYVALFIPLLLANLVRQQMYWYVLPSIPPMAATMAISLSSATKSVKDWTWWAIMAAFLSGVLAPYCFDHAPWSRWFMAGGQLLCLLAAVCFPTRRSFRAAALMAAAAVTLLLGVSPANGNVNLSEYKDCREEHRLAASIRGTLDAPGRLVLNFRHYPANCLMFYSRRNSVDFREFFDGEMKAGETRLGVFTGDSFRGIVGVEVLALESAGPYSLFRLANNGDRPVRPRLE